MKPTDAETGISLRFIRQYETRLDVMPSYVDRVLFSCRWLGHTFSYNADDYRCLVCGAPNPTEAA